MRLLAVGGGSGGHVTPVVAVLKEVKRRDPDAEIRFWCDHRFEQQARSVMGNFDSAVKVDTISSGKLRRYYHLTLWQQLIKVRTIVLPNLIDMVKVIVGLGQSLYKLLVWRPDVVFTKGGFVCLPVGMAARILHIPLVIHDSDAHPGLTNRILAHWAARIGTGAPLKFYPYSAKVSRYVGVPIMPEFEPYSKERKRASKRQLGFDVNRPLVVVTGGGLGARRLNMAVVHAIKSLLSLTNVILISGEAQYDEVRAAAPMHDSRFRLEPFVSHGMADMLGAADIVVARAGATTLLELAALAEPTVLVPNGFLTGGHQLKNAAVYAEKGAVKIIDDLELEAHPELLTHTLHELLADPAKMHDMGNVFHQFAKPHAARDMAKLIFDVLEDR